MCIIIYNETGKPHNEDYLSTAYDNNPHGVGIMWVEDNKVQTLRGLFSKRKMFDILREFEGVPHVIHLRWRTRGKVSKEMCHPFRASADELDSKVWLMHNGTFMKIKSDENHSDTYYFARSLRNATGKHGTDILFTETFLRKLEDTVESYNKVIFLRNDGKVSIVNPKAWHIEDEIWYSNTYSMTKGYRDKKSSPYVTSGWSSYKTTSRHSFQNPVSTKPTTTVTKDTAPKTLASTKQTTGTNASGQTVHTINGIQYELSEKGFWVKSSEVVQAQTQVEDAEEMKPRRLFGNVLYAKFPDGIWRKCEDQDAELKKFNAKSPIVTPAPSDASDAFNMKGALKSQVDELFDTLKNGNPKRQKGKGKRSRQQKKKERNARRAAAAAAKRETVTGAITKTKNKKVKNAVIRRSRRPDGTSRFVPVYSTTN